MNVMLQAARLDAAEKLLERAKIALRVELESFVECHCNLVETQGGTIEPDLATIDADALRYIGELADVVIDIHHFSAEALGDDHWLDAFLADRDARRTS